METSAENDIEPQKYHWRILVWSAAACLLLLPLVAMQFSNEVNWKPGDFIIFGFMLVAACGMYELATRITGSFVYRAAAAIAIAAGFILVWINLAVGMIGNEGNSANLMYVGVLAVGGIGVLLARFKPEGMARALYAMAIAQVLVAVIALVGGLETRFGPLVLNLFFVAMFLGSAFLFSQAARGRENAN